MDRMVYLRLFAAGLTLPWGSEEQASRVRDLDGEEKKKWGRTLEELYRSKWRMVSCCGVIFRDFTKDTTIVIDMRGIQLGHLNFIELNL